MHPEDIYTLNEKFRNEPPNAILTYFIENYGGRIALSTSLSVEDQVITDMICKIDPHVQIFTLDTGMLFPKVRDLIDETNVHYRINMQIFRPDAGKLAEVFDRRDINMIYESIENRKKCCYVRKLEPLGRAFKGLDAWICGLRREQSVTRTTMNIVEWDQANNLLKINPVINWTEAQVWEYIHANAVPYNPMHDNGYPSIGCEPCTRAIEPDEDVRAGRWWWELPEFRECGLHKK